MPTGHIDVPLRRGSMLEGLRVAARRAFGQTPRDGSAAGAAGWYSADEAIMGTAIHAELWGPGHRLAEAAIAAVMAEMHRVDEAMSPHKPDSELSRINRDAGQGPVAISREMFELVARSIEFSHRSNGAFDITFAAVGNLFDYRNGTMPAEAEVAAARAAVGYQHLVLDRSAGTIRFGRPGMRIDLGGFAKGHAVDNCATILRRLGIEHAIVSAGGDSRIIGDRRGRPWTVGVRDPRRAGQVVALLPLENAAVSTSGDYERFFVRDGIRHHHVIDPRTGRSPDAIHSVTIIATDGLTTEALAKCVFVMGLDAGLRLIETFPGVDAVVVDAAGKLHYSSGLLDRRPAAAAQ